MYTYVLFIVLLVDSEDSFTPQQQKEVHNIYTCKVVWDVHAVVEVSCGVSVFSCFIFMAQSFRFTIIIIVIMTVCTVLLHFITF